MGENNFDEDQFRERVNQKIKELNMEMTHLMSIDIDYFDKIVTDEDLKFYEDIKKIDDKYLNNFGKYIKHFKRMIKKYRRINE